jgi:hypothetical protein
MNHSRKVVLSKLQMRILVKKMADVKKAWKLVTQVSNERQGTSVTESNAALTNVLRQYNDTLNDYRYFLTTCGCGEFTPSNPIPVDKFYIVKKKRVAKEIKSMPSTILPTLSFNEHCKNFKVA